MTGRREMKLALALLAVLLPLDAQAQPLPCLPILCYHQVSSHPSSEYEVSREDFFEQMRYLKERGYITISLRQWLKALEGGGSLPARPAVLTFDDGHISAYEVVFPLLESLGLKGAFFVPAEFLLHPESQHVSCCQMRKMARRGMEMMPHGFAHINLTKRSPGEDEFSYDSRIREEVTRSQSLIQACTKRPSPFFAYPYGAYDREVEEIAGEIGFALILTACPGVNTMDTPRYGLRRQLIYRDDGLEGFSRKLTALSLEARFPFDDGSILVSPPERIDVDLPHPIPHGSFAILLLDRREVASSYDSAGGRISLVPPSPLRPGLHILEVRVIDRDTGQWHQDSVLFAIRPPEPTTATELK